MLTYQRTEGRDPRDATASGSQAPEGRSPSGSSLSCPWSLHAAAVRATLGGPDKGDSNGPLGCGVQALPVRSKTGPPPGVRPLGGSDAQRPLAPSRRPTPSRRRPRLPQKAAVSGQRSSPAPPCPYRGEKTTFPTIPRDALCACAAQAAPQPDGAGAGSPRQAEVESLDCGRDVIQATEVDSRSDGSGKHCSRPLGLEAEYPEQLSLRGPASPDP